MDGWVPARPACRTLARCVAVRLLPSMLSMRRRMEATSVVLMLRKWRGRGGGTCVGAGQEALPAGLGKAMERARVR